MKESEQPPKENSGHSFTEGMELDDINVTELKEPAPKEYCGSDSCPNDGACDHCSNPVFVSEEPAHTVDNTEFLATTYANVSNLSGMNIEWQASYKGFLAGRKSVSPSPERGESDGWISVENETHFDGDYQCFFQQKQECGNIWKWQEVVRNSNNKWVSDKSEFITHYRKIFNPPVL